MTEAASVKSRALSGTAWSVGTLFFNQGSNFVLGIILARLLGPGNFGLVAMAMVFANMVDGLVDFGFGSALIQAEQITEIQKSTVFYLNMMLGLFFMAMMILIAPAIAAFFEMPQLELITRVLSVTFLIKGLNSVQQALFKRDLNFKALFWVQAAATVVSGGAGVVLAFIGFGVWALVISSITGWCITTLVLWFLSDWRPRRRFQLRSVEKLWKFGYKYSLLVLFSTVWGRLDTMVIGKIFDNRQLGLYNRAQAFNTQIVQTSFGAVAGVLLPALSRYQNNRTELAAYVVKIIHVVCFLTFLVGGAAYVNAKEFILVLYGGEWAGAIPYFRVVGLFTFTLTIPPVLVSALNAVGRSGTNLWIEVIKKSLLALSIPIAVWRGAYEYIWAVNILAALTMLLNIWSMRHVGIGFWKTLGILFLYAAGFVLFVPVVYWGFETVNPDANSIPALIVKGMIYAGCYAGIAFAFRLTGALAALSLARQLLQKTGMFRRWRKS